ncbi:7-deoxyloganetin glucosyltransferase-like [Chenopodium quinoa]|uniref:7-deoxyloganetin glucosyltransferase-like n=1 Tax=Chenopodium quinoa TaxID=63459 RepID=UPI000B78A862|nr:7-deoxyloganetin glucosyltransferase-like [Chenopodium quinoa]
MKNHVVCIPFPSQGHIRPMLKLAKILHFKFGFHITFINTLHNHQTLFQSQQYYHQSITSLTFRFESIPVCNDDNNNDDNNTNPKDIMSVINSILNNHLGPPLKKLLLKLGSKDYYQCLPKKDLRPPVTCMVSDVGMSMFTLDVADEMGVPAVALQTCSGCGMMGYLQHRQLLDKGIIPLKDSSYLTNGYLDKTIDWIPSLKGIRLKDMPSSIRTTDPNDKMMNYMISSEHKALNSQAIIINTFDALEQDVLKDLSSISPNIYPIGPLNLLVDHIVPKDENNRPIGPSPKEDVDYIQWLDSNEPNSVLYVNFGTLVVLTQEKLIEFAWGLANSHHNFFWVVKSDLVFGGSNNNNNNHFLIEFEEEIKERGLLTSWCDQEKVLGHPSIGGFVTHCGWNSMIESISNGVPMICCPFFAEQGTNSWYCCTHLGIGVSMSEAAKRDDVERVVKELMEEENGKEMMKKKAMEWRQLAKEATMSPHGSSYVNLENVVNDILLSN